jgi:hypothetical protein
MSTCIGTAACCMPTPIYTAETTRMPMTGPRERIKKKFFRRGHIDAGI